MPKKLFKPKEQIAYIPNHAGGDINHPHVEFGFVTSSIDEYSAFCRYWSKENPRLLRTTANSENTPTANLVHHVSALQSIVDHLYTTLGYK